LKETVSAVLILYFRFCLLHYAKTVIISKQFLDLHCNSAFNLSFWKRIYSKEALKLSHALLVSQSVLSK